MRYARRIRRVHDSLTQYSTRVTISITLLRYGQLQSFTVEDDFARNQALVLMQKVVLEMPK